MAKRTAQTNVVLDEQAKRDAREIARLYNLNGVSAAIRFALRDVMKRAAQAQGSDKTDA